MYYLEIKKLRKNGSSRLEIIEQLLDSDGFTKPGISKDKNQGNSMKFKKQEVMFTATPPPIRRVL